MGVKERYIKTTQIFEKVYVWSTVLMFFLIPISKALPNLFVIPIGLMGVIRFRESVKKLSISNSIIILVFLVLIVLSIISNTFIEDIKTLSKYALVIILLFSLQHLKDRELQERAFSIGVAIALIISTYNAVIALQTLDNVSFGYLFGNTSFLKDVLLWRRPYFGFLILLVIYIHLNKLSKNKGSYNLVIAGIGTLFLFLIAARLSMLLSLLLWFIYGVKIFRNLSIRKRLGILGVGVGMIVLLLTNDGFWQRFQVRSELSWNIERMLDIEPRYVIWPCATSILMDYDNVLLSYNSKENIDNALENCYKTVIEKKSKREWFVKKRYNSHNQFLNVSLRGGLILGIAFFLAFIWAMTMERYTSSQKLLVFLFFCFLMLENAIDKQLSASLFGVFLSINLLVNDD